MRRPALHWGGDPRHPHPGGLPHPAQPDGEPDPGGHARLRQVHRGPGPGRPAGPPLRGHRRRAGEGPAHARGGVHHPLWGGGLPQGGDRPSGPAGEILGPGDRHRRGLRHPAGELPPPPPKRRHFLPGAGPVQAAEEGAPPLPEGEPGGHVHHPPAHVPPLCGHHRGQRRPGREGGPEVGGSL